ncbi:hypothetical protein WDZ17_01730 [Pseudokineococcus basanitobsidens]|uniref:Uncharacterized protein n=1 Tax=Pseudokineococcus basanitobsidens TaxID=1926649 RepID=A0ABU8RG11_9ACTN
MTATAERGPAADVLALPTPAAVRTVLEGLLGRDVVPGPGPAVTGDDAAGTVAVYARGAVPVGVLALDLRASALLGAALGLVPRGGAEACVEDGLLGPALAENVAELCNVMAPLLPAPGGGHGRLVEVHGSGLACPDDVADALRRPTGRLDLVLDVAGYGRGGMSVLLV